MLQRALWAKRKMSAQPLYLVNTGTNNQPKAYATLRIRLPQVRQEIRRSFDHQGARDKEITVPEMSKHRT